MTASPAFGAADLSNCEREQIHLAGSIQPHGALLVLSESDLVVIQASANAADFLRLARPPLRMALDELGGDLAGRVMPRIGELRDIPIALNCRIGPANTPFDLLVHRAPNGPIVLEFEPVGPTIDLSRHADRALKDIVGTYTLRRLSDETARIFRELTQFDRVMVYRFDESGHGEVLSEERRSGLESYLGNRYPASDIPQIARRLYIRNRVRVLADVEFTPAPLQPGSLADGNELDMSLCMLRSSSPIHVQYLKNMGVRATLVVSIVVGGRLWGLISCHHYEPRFLSFAERAVCELLAEAVATRVAALESFSRGHAEIYVRRLEQRMVETIASEGDWRTALFDGAQALLQPLGATGAALLFDGQILTTGEVPSTTDLRALGTWLDGRRGESIVCTSSLAKDVPAFEPLIGVASGLVAVPVSDVLAEYLLWFRPERIRTVTWGGDPFKAVIRGTDPNELSPRRSFAQWHQVVERTSDPWTEADRTAARLIGDTVADVILQFRAVRVLIAQDELTNVRRQVSASAQPVVIADSQGTIHLVNRAFMELTGDEGPAPRQLSALPRYFVQENEMRVRINDLFGSGRTWRGEVEIRTASGTLPLLARADPILSAPDRVIGFVLMFTDITQRKRAEAARRDFHEEIMDGRPTVSRRLDPDADLLVRNVLASVVENAQLAALEITDTTDPEGMTAILEGVRASVTRAAEVLGHLINHAVREDPPEAR